MPDSEAAEGFLAVLEYLGIVQHFRTGLLTGAAFAASIFGLYVLDPPGTRFSPLLYVLLATVVAVSVAILVTLGLTLSRAISLARSTEIESAPSEHGDP